MEKHERAGGLFMNPDWVMRCACGASFRRSGRGEADAALRRHIESVSAPEEQQQAAPPFGRADILAQAQTLICTEREKEYGSPVKNFTTVAAMWNAYAVARGFPLELQAHDVPAMMALLKVARFAADPGKADTAIDMAGYAALAGELGATAGK